MADLSQLSDEELMAIANAPEETPSSDAQPAQSSDLNSLSDEELMAIAGETPSDQMPIQGVPLDLQNAQSLLTKEEIAALPPALQKEHYGQMGVVTPGESAMTGFKKNILGGEYVNNMAAALAAMTGDDYTKVRDYLNQRDLQAKAEQKGAYYTGAGAGVASQMLMPGLSLGKGVQAGAKVLPTIAKAGAIGALQGGVSGLLEDPGERENIVDPVQAEKRAFAAGTGAALGAFLSAPAPGIRQALVNGKASSELNNIANKTAFMALRGYKADIKKVVTKKQMNQIGQELYDSGVLKYMPKSVDSLASGTKNALDKLNPVHDKILKNADDAFAAIKEAPIKRSQLIESVKNTLSHVADEGDELPAAFQEKNEALGAFLEKFLYTNKEGGKALLNDGMTIKQALKERDSLRKIAKFDSYFPDGVPDEVQAARSLYHSYNQFVDDAVDRIAQTDIGRSKNLFPDSIKDLRRKMTSLVTAHKIATNRSIGDEANRILSPTDYMAGAIGFTRAEPGKEIMTGVLASLANKVIREYGSAVTSGVTRAASKGTKVAEKVVAPIATKAGIPLASMNFGQISDALRNGELSREELLLLIDEANKK